MYWRALLIVVLVAVCRAQNDYEEVHDTCNSLSTYLNVRGQTYNQMYSATPGMCILL